MRVVSINRDLIGYLNCLCAESPAIKVEKGVLRVIDDILKDDDLKTESSMPGEISIWRRHINPDYPDFKPDASYQIVFTRPEPLEIAYRHFTGFEERIQNVLYGKKWPWSKIEPLMKTGEMSAELTGLPNFPGEWRLYTKEGGAEEAGMYATATLNKSVKKPWRKEDMGRFAETYAGIDQEFIEDSIRGVPIVTKIPKIQLGKSFLEDDGTGIALFFSEARVFAEDILLLDQRDKERVKIVRKENGFEGCITYSVPYNNGLLCAELIVK